MIYTFSNLKSHDDPPFPVSFTWNTETGEFLGKDGDYVEELVDTAFQCTAVSAAPSVSYPLYEGRLTPEDLFMILNQFWDVKEVLPSPQIDMSYPEEAIS